MNYIFLQGSLQMILVQNSVHTDTSLIPDGSAVSTISLIFEEIDFDWGNFEGNMMLAVD